MNITLRHFEIVDAVIKCQSITRAAALLEMTQPGLTRAIKALEDQIGKDLFIRTRKPSLGQTKQANARSSQAISALLLVVTTSLEGAFRR